MSEPILPRVPPTAPDVFYPIVPDIEWLKRLVPLGVRTIQLRLKDASADEVDRQVGEGVALCRTYGCQFIVNDYWQAALRHGATDLHLGQEDLVEADLEAIRAAGLRVGISTHTEDELEVALAVSPACVALGPIFETKLKAMRYAPQGLDRISTWRKRIGGMPLVAIGGLTPKSATAALAKGATSVAVITDFFTHPDPESRVAEWLAWAESQRVRSD